jgi:hypothetical protein
LLPATALAAPQWLDGEPHGPAGANVAPDVAAFGDGNAAIWVGADGHVYAAQRPRGGPWGPADDLEPGGGAEFQPPKIAALPDGELVALWVGGEFGFDVRAARRPPGGSWSQPVAIDDTCCPVLEDLVAGADGTAIGLWTSDDGGPETAAKPPGSPTWDPPQDLPNGSSRTELAVAPDGSAVVAQPCSGSSGCLEARFRPAGGDWGPPEDLADTSRSLTGLAVAASPTGSGFTVAWSEDQNFTRGQPSVRGQIFSRDRASGPGGTWGGAELVAESFSDAFSCDTNFGCLDLAAAGNGADAVVWQQQPANRLIGASVRPAGGTWGPAETVEDPVAGDAYPRAAFTALGTLVAAFVADGGTAVHGAHRIGPDDWSFRPLGGAAQDSEGDPALQDVVGDAEGNAATGWADGATPRTAGFDGAGPLLNVALPPSPRQSEPAGFSASADDNWSEPTGISWLFGDGGAANGAAVSHTYGAPGRFNVTATATDAVGNATQSSGPVDVAPAATVTPTPTATPEPDPCGTADTDSDGINDGCDDNNGAERPRPFRTFNATVVSGEVFVKLPAGAARASQSKPPKGFVRLEGAETIPFGSTLDTARGRVALRSAADTRRGLQRAQFYRGRFVVRQVRRPRGKARRRSTKLITVLKLTGSSFRRTCGTRVATVSQRRRRSRRRVRRLFGDGRGRFRTSGRNAAATVRGTRWGVQDRCDGTLITVRRGRVSVRDFGKRKTVVVRAGRTYLARRR